MICLDCREQFSALIDDEVTALARTRLEEHLAGCADCRTGFSEVRRAVEALRTTQLILPRADLGERVVGHVTRQIERIALLEQAASGPLEPPAPGPTACGTTLATPRPALEPASRSPLARSSAFSRWMAAAAVLVALGATLYVRELILDLSRQVEKLSFAQPLDLEQLLAHHGLVLKDGKVLPKEFVEGGRQGQVYYDRRWWEPAELADRLGLRARPLGALELEQVVNEYLHQQGFEKVEGRWILTRDLARFAEGMIETGPGQWKKMDEAVEAALRARGYVLVDNAWLPREQVERLRSSMAINPDLVGEDAHALARMLSRMRLGGGTRHKALTLYPLLASRQTDQAGLTTLHHAGLDVRLAETGDPFQVGITNQGQEDILLMPGDLILGGAYDRVVASAAIVPARSGPMALPVFSAQSGVFRKGQPFDARSGHDLAPLLVRKALGSELRQGAVWAAGHEYARLTPRGETVSLSALYQEPALLAEWGTYDGVFYDLPSANDEVVGVVIGVGDEIVCAEWFACNRLLRENFDRIVRGAAMEAIRRENSFQWESTYPNGLDGARAFLDNVARAELCAPSHTGECVLELGPQILGTASVHRDRPDEAPHVIHAIIFDPSMDVLAKALDWARYRVDREQGAALVEALRRQIQSAPDATVKLRRFRELTQIRSGDVAEEIGRICMSALHDADARIQEEAVRRLGQKPTPEALKELMVVEEEAFRRGTPLLKAAADVLADSGSAEAVMVMTRQVESADPARAAVLLPALTRALLAQSQSRLALEAVGKAQRFWSRHAADERAGAAARDFLRGITRQEFPAPQHVDVWLRSNDPEEFRKSWENAERGAKTGVPTVIENPKDRR